MEGGDDVAVRRLGAEGSDLGQEGIAVVMVCMVWIADDLENIEGAEQVQFPLQLGETLQVGV